MLERKVLAVIGLNPSTADETVDDPTIRRCLGYMHSWGYTALVMLNLHSFRATEPADLKACGQDEIETPEWQANGDWMDWAVIHADLVLCAWGNDGAWNGQGGQTAGQLDDIQFDRRTDDKLRCLRITKAGHPIHPLYQPKDRQPQDFPVHTYLEAIKHDH